MAVNRYFGVALLLSAFFVAGCSPAVKPSISQPKRGMSRDHSAEEGKKRALADIEATNPRILYYGKPWSGGKPLIDDSTGLPVEIAAGCCVTTEFCEETDTYNATIREWAKKHLTVLKGPAAVEFGDAANGLQAGISVIGMASAPEPMLVVKLSVRNVGTAPVRVLSPRAGRKCWKRVPVEVKVGGKVFPYAGPAVEAPPPAISAFNGLKPGETDSTAIVVCPKYWNLELPFEADLTFVLANDSAKADVEAYYQRPGGGKSSTVDGLWVGKVRSNTVRFKMGR